jgi:hypothetical protein
MAMPRNNPRVIVKMKPAPRMTPELCSNDSRKMTISRLQRLAGRGLIFESCDAVVSGARNGLGFPRDYGIQLLDAKPGAI